MCGSITLGSWLPLVQGDCTPSTVSDTLGQARTGYSSHHGYKLDGEQELGACLQQQL